MLMHGKEAQHTKLMQTSALRYSKRGKDGRIALPRTSHQSVFYSTWIENNLINRPKEWWSSSHLSGIMSNVERATVRHNRNLLRVAKQ